MSIHCVVIDHHDWNIAGLAKQVRADRGALEWAHEDAVWPAAQHPLEVDLAHREGQGAKILSQT
jgi:hypothetical protein